MKKTYQEYSDIVEVSYNKAKKTLIFKKWAPTSLKRNKYYKWAVIKAYNVNEIEDDLNMYSLKDLYNITKGDRHICNIYPISEKHISKFNIY